MPVDGVIARVAWLRSDVLGDGYCTYSRSTNGFIADHVERTLGLRRSCGLEP